MWRDAPVRVRGNGTLIPEDIRWIPTVNAGRVERIIVLPGAAVKSDTVLVELSNPQVEQDAMDAEWQFKGVEAELANVRARLDVDKLDEKKPLPLPKRITLARSFEFEVDGRAGHEPACSAIYSQSGQIEDGRIGQIAGHRAATTGYRH